MMCPLVRELAAVTAPVRVPVVVSCRVLGFFKQNYYRWVKRSISARELEDAYLTNAAYDVYVEDPKFGYRFIADELKDAGYHAPEAWLWLLCIKRSPQGRTKAGVRTADALAESTGRNAEIGVLDK